MDVLDKIKDVLNILHIIYRESKAKLIDTI